MHLTPQEFWRAGSFPKDEWLILLDRVEERMYLGGHVKMSGFASRATHKDRVSCEGNRIGATGVVLLLLTRTTICVGARTGQAA